MTVARMKKVDIYAHGSLRHRLIEALHDQGKLHVDNLHERISDECPGLLEEEVLDNRELTVQISKAAFLDKFMDEHATEKPGFIQSLFKEKFEVTSEEYYSVQESLDFEVLYKQCESLDAGLFRVRERLKHIGDLGKELEHWRAMTLPLKEVTSTRATWIVLGKVPVRKVDDLRHALDEATPLVHLSEISVDVLNARIMVVCHREASEEVEEILSAYDFNPVELVEVDRLPAEEIAALEEEEKGLREEEEGYLAKAEELSLMRPRVVLYHEYLVNERSKREVVSEFAHTESAFAVEGWIKESDQEAVRELLDSVSGELVEAEFSDPLPDEKPPTATEQPTWRRPVWLLTRLYGYPDYREFDPTLAITPFFILFFGMCLGDFGYGVALCLICWQLRKRLVVSPKVKEFLKLLIYVGIATSVFGILGGSYFGIEFESLPGFLQKIAVLLPIESEELSVGSPYPFLLLALALGVFQLMVGYVMELVDNVRNGRVMDAIYDQVSMLGLVIGLGVLVVGKVLEIGAITWIGLVFVVVSVLLTIATGGRESESIFGRVANGVFALYSNITGFFGDTLSYVRLFALGMATMLVAMVVNEIGKQLLGIPVLGYVLLAMIVVGGHTFNLGISFIGAFVHPLRLQYVEFFSKFYDNGAKPYDPFRIFSKKLIFKDREYLF
ncbi:MAG: V-type ATP synthase subunit I [Actinomycetota bacterium]|nr:V-type ATP synthase subunit I [Actinomycetota bacterium]